MTDEWNGYYFPHIDEETELFFDLNQDLKTDLSTLDNPKIDYTLSQNQVLDNTHLPWMQLPVDVPWEKIYKEALHLLETECFTQHRSYDGGGWMSLCIHGMSSTHTNVPEDYGLPDEAEYDLSDWTDIAKFCPVTVEWMKNSMPYDCFSRVRFMALLPGGWIAPHRDTERLAGFGATNVAINNPDGCKMVMEDIGEMPFTPGTVFKINTGHVHSVWNRSSEPRIHMIFDGDQSDDMKKMINENYARM